MIFRWVKISTPSIYKKVIQLEEKGYIKSSLAREGKMPEKAIYSLTETGEKEFEHLMHEIASQPIRIFLDFNAVIVNLSQLSSEDRQSCLQDIEGNIKVLKSFLEENIREKEQDADVPETGMAVLRQQYMLAETMETWIVSLK